MIVLLNKIGNNISITIEPFINIYLGLIFSVAGLELVPLNINRGVHPLGAASRRAHV